MFYRKKLTERFQRECLQSEANIIHVSGLPHSGKTSFMHSLLENGILESTTTKLIEINDSVVGEIDTPKGFNIFISNIREFTSGKFTILFDNGEYIPGIFDIIENYIDSTGDNDTRFVILSSLPETETILSMEKIVFRVLPFSFKEFMENRGKSVELIALKNNPKIIPSFLPLLEEYISIGGYPEVVETSNEQREAVIMRIFEDTKNDILAKVKTRDHAVFLKFIQVLATQT
jgi:predicted AAA+ superfamily ATPase